MASAVRARITELLDARGDAPGRKGVTALLLTAIAAATIFGLFATLPELDAGARLRLRFLGGAAVIVFTVEFLLRLWIAPSRRHYILSFPGVVDFLTVLPFWLHLAGIATPMAVILGMLLASVKLARYVPGFGLVAAVFRAERRALFAALVGTLSGDEARLRDMFDVFFTDTDCNWRMTLVPKQERVRAKVDGIEIAGNSGSIVEILLKLANGDRSVLTIREAE